MSNGVIARPGSDPTWTDVCFRTIASNFFGLGSTSRVMTNRFFKLCIVNAPCKTLEILDAIALDVSPSFLTIRAIARILETRAIIRIEQSEGEGNNDDQIDSDE